jgi:hypothetical protein
MLKSHIFWYMVLWHWASSSQHFKGSRCLHLQSQAVHEEIQAEDKALLSFETLGTAVPVRWHHVLEDWSLQDTTTLA